MNYCVDAKTFLMWVGANGENSVLSSMQGEDSFECTKWQVSFVYTLVNLWTIM